MGSTDWQEGGRSYIGIHELIPSLPQLRHLWVDERVLAVPASSCDKDDTWEAKAFDGESQDTIMSRTVASPQWQLLARTFEKLESLRVGFGPLNASWVAEVLALCDHNKLRAFGFDWEWKFGSNKPVRTFHFCSFHGCIDQPSRASSPGLLKPFRGSSLWPTFISYTHTRHFLPP